LKYFNLIYLGIGIALLVVILDRTDFNSVWLQVKQIGWEGLGWVLFLYFLAFCTDVLGWLCCFQEVPFNWLWLRRLFIVRIIGEAFNRITPFASLGGEPLKALLLKKHYRLDYQSSITSLVLSTTIDTLGLVVFLTIGFIFLLAIDAFDLSFKLLAGLGLLVFSFGTIAFFLIQKARLTTSLIDKLDKTRFYSTKLDPAFKIIKQTEGQLSDFYNKSRTRFYISLVCAFLNWPFGVLEVYYVLKFLGRSIGLSEAWTIESVTQLVRNGTFFIPSSIGTQEGAFLLVCATITSSPMLGISLSAIRRLRELIWICLGLIYWILWGNRKQ
jgi:glycosyltransferase 2 family protein